MEKSASVHDGRAQFTEHVRFRHGMAAIAYSALLLSQFGERAVLRCAECKTFTPIESTGGNKMSRFCSPKCRIRFNVREFRKRELTGGKHK